MRHLLALVALLLAATVLPAGSAGAVDPTAATQPAAPTSGPGKATYRHRGWKVELVGHGASAAYVFVPKSPKPATAPLAIITHGYFEYSGYDQMYELVRHTVLSGNVVIYPRYQTSAATPCPGPFAIGACLDSTTKGIHRALAYLRAHPDWTQPRLDRTSYFGFSFGGIITADLTNRWEKLRLPQPRAVFLDDPHDGGLAGTGEPALDRDLSGIPTTAKVVCHSGADGVLATKPDSSCNALFPRLAHLPQRNKELVMTRTDTHGQPTLSSEHGVCAGGRGTADAYDWNFCWRTWDVLRQDGPTVPDLGTWSDGVPLTPLVVAAPGALLVP